MNNYIGKRGLQLLAVGALFACASLAHAQYMWIDEKGLKQFSDSAPPPSIPLKNILKAPKIVAAEADAAGGTAPVPSANAAPSLADREADYSKRHQKQAEQESKAAAEASKQAAKNANCNAARARQAVLSSGKRVRGENGYLDDTTRAQQNATIAGVLAQCNS